MPVALVMLFAYIKRIGTQAQGANNDKFLSGEETSVYRLGHTD